MRRIDNLLVPDRSRGYSAENPCFCRMQVNNVEGLLCFEDLNEFTQSLCVPRRPNLRVHMFPRNELHIGRKRCLRLFEELRTAVDYYIRKLRSAMGKAPQKFNHPAFKRFSYVNDLHRSKSKKVQGFNLVCEDSWAVVTIVRA